MKIKTTLCLIALLACISLKTIAQKTDSSSIFNAVEHIPEFPGGIRAFNNFLSSNIKYPVEAIKNNVQGRVFLTFVIEKDGSLSNMKIVRDPGSGLGDEALRVLALSPKWNPGTQNGKNVRVAYTIPVNFALPTATHEHQLDTTKGKIFTGVEVNPTFPGGDREFNKYVAQHIRYPKEARENRASGRVFAQFIIEKDGSLSDIQIVRDPGYGMGNEALRVLKDCPKWQPGMQGGKPVRVMFTVPVTFSLSVPYTKP